MMRKSLIKIVCPVFLAFTTILVGCNVSVDNKYEAELPSESLVPEKIDAPFVVNETAGFETLQEAFNSVKEGEKAVIEVNKSFTGSSITKLGTEITLNLNGFTIDGCGENTITNNGILTIQGNGLITNTLEGKHSKSLVNYGTLVMNEVTLENETTSVALWNSNNGLSNATLCDCVVNGSRPDCILIINSGEMTLESGTVTGVGDALHPAVYNNTDSAMLTINGGIITNSGEGYAIYREAGTVNTNNILIENTYGVD